MVRCGVANPKCWGYPLLNSLTHWDRVTHICVSKLAIIVSDNGLAPGRCQAIIWTNAGILLIGLLHKLHWNLNRNQYNSTQEIAFENVVCTMASISSRPQWVNAYIGLFGSFISCDEAALCMIQSVRLSVRLSHLFDNVLIVSSWNF